MFKKTIRIGASGSDVEGLQNILTTLGYYAGKIDGRFGPKTTRAVLAFQTEHKLEPDGVVGSITWGELERQVQTEIAPISSSKSTAKDPGAPYLLFDLYPFDLDNPKTKQIEDPDFKKVYGRPSIRGGILKATDGVRYGYTDWFVRNYKALKDVAGTEYGKTWFRGSYHYLQFLADGKAQAEYYVSTVEKAGGWDSGAILPVMDVEFGGERSNNRHATSEQIIACAQAFTQRVTQLTGKPVILYGRSLMRDLTITNRLGCDRVWNPSYTERMVTNGLVRVGDGPGPWGLKDIVLWQYGGDGVGNSNTHKLPLEIEGFGKIDMSVHINGAAQPTIETFKEALISS